LQFLSYQYLIFGGLDSVHQARFDSCLVAPAGEVHIPLQDRVTEALSHGIVLVELDGQTYLAEVGFTLRPTSVLKVRACWSGWAVNDFLATTNPRRR
jgi:hypothetical protein